MWEIVENSFQTNHRQHQWNFLACILHLKKLHYKNNILCFKCIYSKSDVVINHLHCEADFDPLDSPLSTSEVVMSCQMTFDPSSFVIDLSRLTLKMSEGERTFEKLGRPTPQ